jgi:NADH-quinone oxidoreductase subunit G
MIEANPVFAAVDQIQSAPWGGFGAPGQLDPAPFGVAVDNFYMTDPISRASETMAKCTETFVLGKREATGTDG